MLGRLLRHKRVRELGVLVLVTWQRFHRFWPLERHASGTAISGAIRGDPLEGMALDRDREPDEGRGRAALRCGSWRRGVWLRQCLQRFSSDGPSLPTARSPARVPLQRHAEGLVESFFRWPSMVFSDPLAALVEKEIRFLAAPPRFRLVFLMGFTFGLVIWLPIRWVRCG